MIELVYLNKNISKEDADKLVSEGIKTRNKLYEKMISNMETLDTDEQKTSYLLSCAPILTWF